MRNTGPDEAGQPTTQTTTAADPAVAVVRRGVRRLDAPVRLASGAWSCDFVDVKEALARWEDLEAVCSAIVARTQRRGWAFGAVGGLSTGADAVAVGVAAAAGCEWFFVRKKPKSRGTRRRVEGARLSPGDPVLLVDDVATTGASLLDALDAVTAQGAVAVGAAVVADRGDAAGPRLEAAGVPYLALCDYRMLDIAPVAGSR